MISDTFTFAYAIFAIIAHDTLLLIMLLLTIRYAAYDFR